MKAFTRTLFAAALLLTSQTTLESLQACEGEGCHDFLVRFSSKANPEQISAILYQEGLDEVQFFPGSKLYRVEGSSEESSAKLLKRLNRMKGVAYAEPNYRVEASRAPNDPYYSSLWGLHNTGQSGGTLGDDIGMESVWNNIIGAPSIVVAVIDTGIDYTHPDLAANLWTNSDEIPSNGVDDDHNGYIDDYYGYNFDGNDSDPMDDHFHGTHVAGTIGAVGDNGIGVTGVNWNTKLMAVKFLNSSGSGYLSDAINAIEYSVNNGAKVLNNSWGFMSWEALPSNPALEPVQSLRDAIEYADQNGVIFVAAAGNDGVNSDQFANYPSAYSVQNILSVASTDRNDALSSFSNYGQISVDLGAPGSAILSTYPTWYVDPPYATISGTSMATPHVAGAAALVWEDNLSLSHRQVIDRINQGTTDISALANKSVTGGRLNVWQSILLNDPNLNHAPIANAGADQYKEVGDTVSLQGSATDEDGDTAFTYSWTLTAPAGSQSVLSSNNSANSSFVADIVGNYSVSLIASDWNASSIASTTVIHVAEGASNRPTVVIRAQSEGTDDGEATIGSQVSIGERIYLNGTQSASGSANANPSVSAADSDDTLSYSWSFIERPTASNSTIYDNDQAVAYFYPDASGRYTVQLSVSNGQFTSTGEISFQAGSATPGTESSGGGSGGCNLSNENKASSVALPLFLFSSLVFVIWRRRHLHSNCKFTCSM